jgi:hypothetical protein
MGEPSMLELIAAPVFAAVRPPDPQRFPPVPD